MGGASCSIFSLVNILANSCMSSSREVSAPGLLYVTNNPSSLGTIALTSTRCLFLVQMLPTLTTIVILFLKRKISYFQYVTWLITDVLCQMPNICFNSITVSLRYFDTQWIFKINCFDETFPFQYKPMLVN